MPKPLKPNHLAALLRPGMTVFVQGASSEPTTLLEALAASPEACAGVHFLACQIPGLNRFDFAGLHPNASSTGLFVTPETVGSYSSGKMRYMPLPYSAMYRYLQTKRVDVAFIQVTPPDRRGRLSFGSSVHFAPAVLDRAETIVAEINDNLPAVGQSVALDEASLDYVLPTSHALPTLDPGPTSDVSRRIGAHIAGLVRDGDYVQIGIGKLPNAMLEALRSHRRLSCHGGLISDGMIELYEAGALDPGKKLVCTSVVGTTHVYNWVRGRKDVHVRPVCKTHDIRRLAELRRFIAINSVFAVDLFGQANAETIDGCQSGGCGGLPDFVRAAQLSEGGRSILALPSTAGGGMVSRIVPALKNEIVSSPRTDADYVVTEHGVADLRYKSLDERTDALIQIADPKFHADLFEGSRRAN